MSTLYVMVRDDHRFGSNTVDVSMVKPDGSSWIYNEIFTKLELSEWFTSGESSVHFAIPVGFKYIKHDSESYHEVRTLFYDISKSQECLGAMLVFKGCVIDRHGQSFKLPERVIATTAEEARALYDS